MRRSGAGTTLSLVRNPIRLDGEARARAASPAPRRAHRRGAAARRERDRRLARAARRVGDPARDPRGGARVALTGFPTELFRARGRRATEDVVPATTERALERSRRRPGARRRVRRRRDVTPAAGRAGVLIGVDAQEDMLEGFRANARAAGADVETVHGRWPTSPDEVSAVDVAVAGHVLYNVADLEPFVRASAERTSPGGLRAHRPPSVALDERSLAALPRDRAPRRPDRRRRGGGDR